MPLGSDSGVGDSGGSAPGSGSGEQAGAAAPETGSVGGSPRLAGVPQEPSLRPRVGASLTLPPFPPQVWSSAASSSRRTSMASASPSAGTASSWCSRCGQVRAAGAGRRQGEGRGHKMPRGPPLTRSKPHSLRENVGERGFFSFQSVTGLVSRCGVGQDEQETIAGGEGRRVWGKCFLGKLPRTAVLSLLLIRRRAGGRGVPCRSPG